MAASHSSHGWSPPDRAPRLRRAADLLMLQADKAEHPDRVRRVARDLRIRAAEAELGQHGTDEFDDAVDTIAAAASTQ